MCITKVFLTLLRGNSVMGRSVDERGVSGI